MKKFQDMKVLLAEDEVNARKTILMMLKEMGITQIFESADGQIAQEVLDTEDSDIDLVISDWNMPHKNGANFLQDLRSKHPTLPFIMITGRADVNSVTDAVNYGVTAYIRKPFTLNELESKIKFALKE